MNRVIWKYVLRLQEVDEINIIEMPYHSKVISAINQNETIAIYAIVDPDDSALRPVRIRVEGTGKCLMYTGLMKPRRMEMLARARKVDAKDLLECSKFLATLQFMSSNLILHIFEVVD